MDTPTFCKLENVFILFLLLIIADFPEEMYSLWIKGGQGKKKRLRLAGMESTWLQFWYHEVFKLHSRPIEGAKVPNRQEYKTGQNEGSITVIGG